MQANLVYDLIGSLNLRIDSWDARFFVVLSILSALAITLTVRAAMAINILDVHEWSSRRLLIQHRLPPCVRLIYLVLLSILLVSHYFWRRFRGLCLFIQEGHWLLRRGHSILTLPILSSLFVLRCEQCRAGILIHHLFVAGRQDFLGLIFGVVMSLRGVGIPCCCLHLDLL